MAIAAIDEALGTASRPVPTRTDRDPRQLLLGKHRTPRDAGDTGPGSPGLYDAAIAFGTPFISGKDTLNNEFAWDDESGQRQNVPIPSTC
ncbi:MAG: hypothetical protein CM1200mP2_09680 [Planctomycetaceae bacterium]|nr:MAG: hypothetical protein CM1200mP2_09680 [Planctomycetaceae bacterium]